MKQMNQQTVRNQQIDLYNYITQLDFAILDFGLYLDTHPCDQDALLYYKEYQKMYKQAVDDYTTYFGPLCDINVNTDQGWTWTKEPWPWEGEDY